MEGSLLALVLLLQTASANDSLPVHRVAAAWWGGTTVQAPGAMSWRQIEAPARDEALRGWLAELDALAGAAEPDATTVALLRERMEAELALETCRFEAWVPVGLDGLRPYGESIASFSGGLALATAYFQLPERLERMEANLREGLADGRVAGVETLDRRIAEIDAALATERFPPLGEQLPSPLLWDERDVRRFRTEMAGAWKVARPALEEWRRFLAEELRPAAKPGSGLARMDDGCYAALIAWSTTQPLTAGDVERRGEEALAEAHARLLAWGQPHGIATVAELREATASRVVYGDVALARAARLAALAEPAVTWFEDAAVGPVAVRPGTACVGSYDDDEMFLRTENLAPAELAVVVFHEGVPGHHLQVEIAGARRDLPPFRRRLYLPFYSEGWAFHAEDIAGELGLYTSEFDRLGWAAFDAWRAARLLLDVGLHEHGWSEQQGVDFLLANTLLSEATARCDVERAIERPAQGLGYVYGRDAIRALRAEARSTLGERYDDAAFHRAVLRDGPLTKELLEQRVRAWMAEAANP